MLAFKKKDEDELDSDLEKWIYNIKNLGHMETAPKMAKTAPFDRLYNLAEVAAMPTRKRHQYELSLKNYRDMLADKETTRNMVKRERAEGRAEGRAENQLEVAKSLKLMGVLNDEQIAQVTGLPIEAIAKL